MLYNLTLIQPSAMLITFALMIVALPAAETTQISVSVNGKQWEHDTTGDPGHQLGRMVGQVVTKYLAGCHLVTVASGSSLLYPLIKDIFGGDYASVVVEVPSLFLLDHETRLGLLKGLWTHHKDTCRGLILDVTVVDAHALLHTLEPSDLWLQPNTAVVFVGDSGSVEEALFHLSLRNTLHTLYLALPDDTLQYLTARKCILPSCRAVTNFQEPATSYWRCLYCDNGEPDIRTYGPWDLQYGLPDTVQLFPDQTHNFMGHTFKIVGLDFFPIMEYTPDSDQPGTSITLTDCLDRRILTTVAAVLNFTYIVREPLDGEWGLDQGGNSWTGIVGELQYDKSDFSLLLGLVYSRAQVMDYSSIYINDRWVIISLKRQPLTQYLALVKPFTGIVWLGIVGSTGVLGIVLWLFNRAWKWLSNERGMSLASSLLYSWGALLSSPTGNPPVTFTIRVLIAWLWIFTVVVTSAYKSSLIAHLTVRISPLPINSFQDLIESSGVSWGSEPLYGTEVLFFNSSLDPVVQEFYSKLEFDDLDNHMKQVMEGRHAFFNSITYMRHVIASRYTDNLGYTPLHFSHQQYPTSAGSVWGVRRGAPFNEALTRTRVRLTEVGLFDYWMEDVINTRAKKIREGMKEKDRKLKLSTDGSSEEDSGGQEVLGLNHLQGCFYLLFIGQFGAVVVLLLENGIWHIK